MEVYSLSLSRGAVAAVVAAGLERTTHLPNIPPALAEMSLLAEALVALSGEGLTRVELHTTNPLTHEGFGSGNVRNLSNGPELVSTFVDTDHLGWADELCLEAFTSATGHMIPSPEERCREDQHLILEWAWLQGYKDESLKAIDRSIFNPRELTTQEAAAALKRLPKNALSSQLSYSPATRYKLARAIALGHFAAQLNAINDLSPLSIP